MILSSLLATPWAVLMMLACVDDIVAWPSPPGPSARVMAGVPWDVLAPPKGCMRHAPPSPREGDEAAQSAPTPDALSPPADED